MFLGDDTNCKFLLAVRKLKAAMVNLILFQMMSASVLIVLTFLIVNSFWSDVQALPPFSLHEGHNKFLPHLAEFPRVDPKRQFDPWGGKKRSHPSPYEEMTKRQFSPWGGKRSHDMEAINGTRAHSRNDVPKRQLPTLRIWVNAISWYGVRKDSLQGKEVSRQKNEIPKAHLILRQQKCVLVL